METLADVMPEITPADEQPEQRRRQRHQHIIQRQPEIRQQDDGAAAEPVGQRAKHRRKEKLHQRPCGAEQAEDLRGTRGVVVDKAFHEFGQDRHDQAERHHVEQDGDEDEGDRTAADLYVFLRHFLRHVGRVLRGRLVHEGRLRLWANGLAFSRNEIRTGVPGSSKTSRIELTR